MSNPLWFNDFINPPAIFRPVPFWSWNERMIPDEVRQQINLMADAGWGGVMIHSRQGLITPYLGDEWFDSIDAAVDQCRKHGLKVWLYDEDKWPSGFSSGTVPVANASFRMKALIARPEKLTITENIEPLGRAINGIKIYVWTAPLGHDFFNGTCFTDHMNREAMRKFLVEAYESYHTRYKDDYGQLIVAEFTDEPCTIFRRRLPIGAVPYTEALPEHFKQMHGYDPVGKFHLLFDDLPDAERFRIHYFRTINFLFENNYSRQLGDWCAKHNIALTGHYMLEDNLYGQQCWGVNIMPNYRHMGIPGIDHLGRQITERHTAKQCQSIANQYGKKRLISEMYGCSGQGLSFEDRLWIASQQICLGVNLLNYHLSLYTMAGCRKRDYPPNIFYQQPWWPLTRILDESLSRACVALSQGRYHAEVLVVHPQQSTFALWRTKTSKENPVALLNYDDEPTTEGVKNQLQALNMDLESVTSTLLGNQHTFDFADEIILNETGRVEIIDGRPVLQIEQMNYPVVILPSMITIAAATMELLKRFQEAGGYILRCGKLPELLDGEPSKELQNWVISVPKVTILQLPALLKSKINPAVEVLTADINNRHMLYVHLRDLEDGDRLVYLVNLDRTTSFDAKVKFSGSFSSIYHLDMYTGSKQELSSVRDNNSLIIDLPFARTQSHLLQLSHRITGKNGASLLSSPASETFDIDAFAWQVERLDDNAITLDYAYWQESNGAFSQKPVPVIAIQKRLDILKYDGPLSLRYPVHVRDLSPNQKVDLVVEYPERYQIQINGRITKLENTENYLDFRWKRLNITGLLKEGENIVELQLRHFQHGDPACYEYPSARYGTEIESIYLVGDFSVAGGLTSEKPVSPIWKQWAIPSTETYCLNKESLCITDNFEMKFGNCVTQGSPFYAGRLKMSADIPSINLQGDRAILKIEKLDAAVAQVKVNEKIAGYFISHPLEIDITKEILQGGKTLSITLYGTLRNLLGPHHHIDGELPAVSPEWFQPWHGYTHDIFSNIPHLVTKWGMDGQCPGQWRDSYCMVSFGNVGKVRILRVNNKMT